MENLTPGYYVVEPAPGEPREVWAMSEGPRGQFWEQCGDERWFDFPKEARIIRRVEL